MVDKIKCCGCTACMNICPVDAIRMKPDKEGFLYPVIDKAKCIMCNACVQICTFKNGSIEKKPPMEIWAAQNRDINVRMASSSGGVFTSIYRNIISQKGIVYGARFDADFAVQHARAVTEKECETFRGAKYVQSDMSKVYAQVKHDLERDEKVLFSGTPCQVAGLKSYLRNNNTYRLITCDVICHGVASPLIWEKYLELIKNRSQIKEVHFRNKENGWHHSRMNIKRTDGTSISQEHAENPYTDLYFSHYILRKSCAICPYATFERVGDITIGDFWGIEHSILDFDDDLGTSLVMINSDKGKRLLEEILDMLNVRATDREHCIQPNLVKPSSLPVDREKFWRRYQKKGLKTVMKNYTSYGNQFMDIRIKRCLAELKNKFI